MNEYSNILIGIYLPIVGIVVTTSPNFNLYNIVVFPKIKEILLI